MTSSFFQDYATIASVYEGPWPAHIRESFQEALRLRARCRVTRWKLTDSQLDDLAMVSGQNQHLLGVPVVKSPLDLSDRERDGWADEVVALYLSDVDMESDEFEQLLDAAMSGQKPDHPRLPARLPIPRNADCISISAVADMARGSRTSPTRPT